jgi:hypothetical protein
VPLLVLDDGSAVCGSGTIAAWAREQAPATSEGGDRRAAAIG